MTERRPLPDWVGRVRARFGEGIEAGVVEELADHAADSYRAAVAEGVAPEAAEAAVEREIEAWARERAALRRGSRRSRLTAVSNTRARVLPGLGGDLSQAARALRRKPARSALVVLTMALGIGTTTVLFSVVHGVLLAPLPWPGADRLVQLEETREGATRTWPGRFTHRSYRAWADGATTVEGLAAWGRSTATLTEAGAPMELRCASVTASLLPLLGAEAEIGDLFTEDDEGTGGVVLLSEGLWEERFGRSADVVGRVVRLDRKPHRIVGVIGRGFAFPDRETRAWVPFGMPPVREGGGYMIIRALARLAPGVTPEIAAQEASLRAAQGPEPGPLEVGTFGTRGRPVIRATPLVRAMTEEVRPALLLLLAAVGLLLLAATANVAGLQLAAATARGRELAVRAAVGAKRGRLVRLLLAESLLLGLLGGALGIALAAAAQRFLPAVLPADFPRLRDVALDVRVAAFAAALSVGTGIAFGMLPALFAGRVRLTAALARDGAGSLGPGRSGVARARAAMLAGQVALACVLLLGALQLGRSFFAQLNTDRGYEPAGLLVTELTMPDERFTPERRGELMTTLMERLRAYPGIEEAAFANLHPMSEGATFAVFPSRPDRLRNPDAILHADVRAVSPGYFRTLGRRLIAGRFFDERDLVERWPGLVVNRTFAERYLDEPAVGSMVSSMGTTIPDREVIGVVEDVRSARLTEPPQPESLTVIRPGKPLPGSMRTVLVRTRWEPEAVAPTLRALLRELDPSLASSPIRTMNDLLDDSLAQPRLYSTLVGIFAACALVIAGAGVFGVLSHTVALRRREIGVRVALGARPADVVRLVGRRGLALTGLGLALGLAAFLAGSRLLEGFLYGVRSLDAASVASVTAALGLVALAATVMPARRAATIEPHRALREE